MSVWVCVCRATTLTQLLSAVEWHKVSNTHTHTHASSFVQIYATIATYSFSTEREKRRERERPIRIAIKVTSWLRWTPLANIGYIHPRNMPHTHTHWTKAEFCVCVCVFLICVFSIPSVFRVCVWVFVYYFEQKYAAAAALSVLAFGCCYCILFPKVIVLIRNCFQLK